VLQLTKELKEQAFKPITEVLENINSHYKDS
jgi:hypothetical protein